MAEPEAPRDVGDADEVELQELVDGVHRRSLGHVRRGGGQLGLERIARHRGSFEHQAAVSDSRPSSSVSEAATADGHPDVGPARRRRRGRPARRSSDRASCSR